jgi:hypothetical protein
VFSPTGVFGDRLYGAAGQEAELTEVHKVSFSDYLLSSVNHFDCFEYALLLCERLKP